MNNLKINFSMKAIGHFIGVYFKHLSTKKVLYYYRTFFIV